MIDESAAPYASRALLEQLGDAVTVIGADWRYRYVSAGAARIIGRDVDEVVGQPVWEIFPEVVGTPLYDACVRAMTSRRRERLVWFFPSVGRWFEQHALPVADGLVIVGTDITEHELAAHRSEQLLSAGEALAQTTSAEDVNDAVVREVFPLVGAAGGAVVLADEERGVMRQLGRRGAADESWRPYALTRDTPATRAYRSGKSVFNRDLVDGLAEFPAIAADLRRSGSATVAALPLLSAGSRLGVLVLRFAAERIISAGDRQFLSTAAAMTAQALVRVRLLEAEKRSIAELQQSLLPAALPVVVGLDVTARYAGSDGTTETGGDWYDVIPLPGGAVALVMGDVEGHDLAAAALMGMVRSAVRAYAVEGHPPAFVLDRANSFLAGLGRGRIVTMSYAHVHPLERLITTCSAGHPGTQVVTPDGSVFEIPAEVGPPLGAFDSGVLWPETTSTLPARSTMATFTDGLVEVRGEEIGVGFERVRALLAEQRGAPVQVLADALIASRRGDQDDVALLVCRLTADAPDSRRFVRQLPAAPASVFLARRFARQLLAAWQVDPDLIATVELVVSELVTNAARHSEDALSVALRFGVEAGDVLRIEVGDTSHRMPLAAAPVAAEATSGRGLLLVQAVASRWGVESDGLSKLVWAELNLAE